MLPNDISLYTDHNVDLQITTLHQLIGAKYYKYATLSSLTHIMPCHPFSPEPLFDTVARFCELNA